jgi:hypothetical protein
MATEFVEATINNKLIRIDKNNSMNVYSWRETKTKPPYWYKIKLTLHTNKLGYKRYYVHINKKMCILSRVVYKAYNNDWDITDSSKNNQVDHINVNSLDNRIENLRILTQQQNLFNTKAKGYTWSNLHNKWQSQIMINNKQKSLGRFENEEDAHQAYLNAKELYHKLPD